MSPWAEIWKCHGLRPLELPGDAHFWPQLPYIAIEIVKTALASFSVRTATGPGRIGVRALLMLSDQGLYGLAALFQCCESWFTWPDARILREMVRLPQPRGGCRLIALMNSCIRVWARIRVQVCKDWIRRRPGADILGL
eukprot:9210488-Pyramimonas_sp.AAC.1